MIRHNTDLLGSVDEHLPDEDVRKHLLELNEDLHDEKREALAVFNNKVETHRRNLHAVATRTETLGHQQPPHAQSVYLGKFLQYRSNPN